MDIRVQQALDGELVPAELSRAEATALREAESLIENVVRSVPNPPVPDLGANVLDRITNLGHDPYAVPSGPHRQTSKSLLAWLFAPRPTVIRWRPAYALGMVAVLALLVVLLPNGPEMESVTPPNVLVQFRLDAPHAQHVALAGDFTDWKPAYTLRRSEPGVWTVVVPLNPGVHDYAFVVDGERWIADPMAPAIADGFGGLNSRLAVLAPDQGSGT